MEAVEMQLALSSEEELEEESEDVRPLIRQARPEGQPRQTRLVYEPKVGQQGARQGTGGCSCRKVCVCLLATCMVAVASFIFLSDRRQEDLLGFSLGPGGRATHPSLDYLDFKQPSNMVSYQEILEEGFSFNLSSSSDVMVFLHIQKTGGTTFGKHLVQDIDLARPCLCHRRRNRLNRKKLHCDCFRPGTDQQNWLFSRYSTGWKCGLHPDWTELTSCVDSYMESREGPLPLESSSRRYFYITFLREPLARYLSEFKHVARGATWRDSLLRCGGRGWADSIPPCYSPHRGDWSGVTLPEFMACATNLAVNRQTRMLADLNLVNCYNSSGMGREHRDKLMLASAKANLEKMAYFGLIEKQKVSQYLFEETFSLEFKVEFEQLNRSDTHSGPVKDKLSPQVEAEILRLNSLDVELYKFASALLDQRFSNLRESDESFAEHMARLGKEKYQFNWEDIEEED